MTVALTMNFTPLPAVGVGVTVQQFRASMGQSPGDWSCLLGSLMLVAAARSQMQTGHP